MAGNSHIIATRHPAIIEYLGENCPLLFKDLHDLKNDLLSNDITDKVISAHEYLQNMDKSIF